MENTLEDPMEADLEAATNTTNDTMPPKKTMRKRWPIGFFIATSVCFIIGGPLAARSDAYWQEHCYATDCFDCEGCGLDNSEAMAAVIFFCMGLLGLIITWIVLLVYCVRTCFPDGMSWKWASCFFFASIACVVGGTYIIPPECRDDSALILCNKRGGRYIAGSTFIGIGCLLFLTFLHFRCVHCLKRSSGRKVKDDYEKEKARYKGFKGAAAAGSPAQH